MTTAQRSALTLNPPSLAANVSGRLVNQVTERILVILSLLHHLVPERLAHPSPCISPQFYRDLDTDKMAHRSERRTTFPQATRTPEF